MAVDLAVSKFQCHESHCKSNLPLKHLEDNHYYTANTEWNNHQKKNDVHFQFEIVQMSVSAEYPQFPCISHTG